jgi:hypothetical protein
MTPREILEKFLEQYGYKVETEFNGDYTEYRVLYKQRDGLWASLEILNSVDGDREADAYLVAFKALLGKMGIQ